MNNNIDTESYSDLYSSNPRVCFFDLETQFGANEVGGWGNVHLMKMAVGVVYDTIEKEYFTYFESEVDSLIEKLMKADLTIGFNIIRFDYRVLSLYTQKDFNKIRTFDMLASIYSSLGYRLSLNHLAQNTLNHEKNADGLISLKWFKEGKLDKIVEYCKRDVEITRDLFMFGQRNGYLLFKKKGDGVVNLSVNWDIKDIISASGFER